MKRWLFFCDTTYQLYTIITIITSSNEAVQADLVVKHGFTDSHKYVSRAVHEKIFDRVYEYTIKASSNRFSAKAEDINKLVFSKTWLKKNLGFDFRSYDSFFAANLDDNVALALYATTEFKDFCLFEDGTGSYRGNIINDYMSWKRKGLLQISHPRKTYFQIDKMLLFAPEISSSTACSSYEKIQASKDNRIEHVFEYKDSDVYDKKIIFLDQSYALDRPAEITAKRKEQDQLLSQSLSPYLNRLVLRPHPRMPEGSIEVLNIDNVRNLWEIECVRKICDKHVLISIYSSAAFQPALVSNKRPSLIFLYKLYAFLYSKEQLEQVENHIQRFSKKLNYNNIFTPKSWEEFRFALTICTQE